MVEIVVTCKCGEEFLISELSFDTWHYCHNCGSSFAEQGIDIPARIAAEQEKERQKIAARMQSEWLNEKEVKYSFWRMMAFLVGSIVLFAAYTAPGLIKLRLYEEHREFFDWMGAGGNAMSVVLIWFFLFTLWAILTKCLAARKFQAPESK